MAPPDFRSLAFTQSSTSVGSGWPPVVELAAAQFALLAPVVCLAAAVQTAVGFGAGLVAIPLLVWAGLALPHAVSVMYGVVLVHASYNLYRTSERRAWTSALRLSSIRWASMPIGVWLMHSRVVGDAATTKRVVGAGLLASLALRGLVRPEPRAKVGRVWGALAGCAGGILAGLVGMGGPPLVPYAMAHDWPPERFRAYLWWLFLMGLPVGIGLLAWAFGPGVWGAFALGAISAPWVWIGSRLGRYASENFSTRGIHRGATLLLLALGLASLATPW